MPTGISTNFPQGFSAGFTVRGVPLLQAQTGNVYWVYNGPSTGNGPQPNGVRNVGGSDTNHGTFTRPFASIAFALSQCQQSNGDIIFVKAGHTETCTAAGTATTNMTALTDPTGTIYTSTGGSANYLFNLNCAGVAIIGLGIGNARPTISYTTAATANILAMSANMSMQNMIFYGNYASVASAFTASQGSAATSTIAGNVLTAGTVTGAINIGSGLHGTGVQPGTIVLGQLTGTAGATGTYTVSIPQTVTSTTITSGPTDFNIESCEFRGASTAKDFLAQFTGTAGAGTVDGFRFVRNKIFSSQTTGAISMFKPAVAVDRLEVTDNIAYSTSASTGPMLVLGSTYAMTNATIARNVGYKPTTVSTGILMTGTGSSTGMFYDNYAWSLATSTGLIITASTGLGAANNYGTITGATTNPNAIINPTAA